MSSRSIVGLEIAEHWVRGVELARPGSRRPVVRAVGEVNLPAGAARDSEVLDSEAVSVALAQLWAQAGFKSKDVILGVGNRRVLVREHVAPALPLDQIKRALQYQVQDMLPVPVEQAVLDFYPVEPTQLADGSDGVAGLLVSAVSENVQGLIAAIERAKLHVVGVDLAPFGLARAATRVIGAGSRALVVHVGASTSWFVVLEDGVPRLVRIVPAGIPIGRAANGNHRANQDAQDAGASEGAPESSADPVQEFVTWFTGTRDFYERSHPEHPLAQVLLTGEGALHPALAGQIQAVSDVEVGTFGLSDAFDLTPTDPAQDHGALTAAGVAIGGEI